MNKRATILAATGLLFTVTAQAANLSPGQYASTGTVGSTNGSANCAAAGLTAKAANNSVITYPGAGLAGFTIYVGANGLLQLCSGFPKVPATGINNFKATGKCGVYSQTATIPPETVTFTFTNRVTDANSGVGQTVVSIPAADPVGGGCTATINTTIVRTGK